MNLGILNIALNVSKIETVIDCHTFSASVAIQKLQNN